MPVCLFLSSSFLYILRKKKKQFFFPLALAVGGGGIDRRAVATHVRRQEVHDTYMQVATQQAGYNVDATSRTGQKNREK